MPSPVEALPCGSRSTISTCSPMAASAVPRLIAVVVLPTPPFWLATTITRGCWPVGMVELPNLQNNAGRIGQAGMLLEAYFPVFAGFGQFRPHILSLEKEANRIRACEMLCI